MNTHVLFIEEGVVHLTYSIDRWMTLCRQSFKKGQPMFNKHRRVRGEAPTCLECLVKSLQFT